MKHVLFELSMPNVGSWNGQWTGAKDYHAIIRSFTVKTFNQLKFNTSGNYYYNFGDGWGANIKTQVVDSKTKAKVQRMSIGFRGYDWMVDSIIEHGKIQYKENAENEQT